MLYHLFNSLGDFPGSRLFTFISFRAIAAFILSMLIALVGGKYVIKWLQRKQIGETIRDLGLQGQMEKKGTPTMGGIIIIMAVVLTALLICDLSNIYTLVLLLTTLWCGAIGFADDYIKVFKHNKEGMSERGKLVAQFGIGLLVALLMCFSTTISTDQVVTTLPFVKSHEFDYSWLSPFSGQMGVYWTWGVYMIIIILVILACSNGANLTDGMDGLSAGTSAIIAIVIGVLAYLGGHLTNADYLNIMYIPKSGEVAVFMAAFVGALLGFLWYNCFPAQVFMGDTGSLAIGGIIGVSAVLIRKELLLPLLCGIFVVESASVLIQRYYFKYTRIKHGEGKRIFLMAPLHHHYQKKGQPEPRIVFRFWFIGILLGVATLALLKIR